MKKLLIVAFVLLALLPGCGSSGSWSGAVATFIGTLRAEAQALGVLVQQEFVKAESEGFVIAIREKESKNVICQTIVSSPAEAGRLTQFIPFARNKAISYQVQILIGVISTPWTDF